MVLPQLLLLLGLICGTAAEEEVSASSGGDRDSPASLFASYFSWRMRTAPEYASGVGVHDYDGALSDPSPAAWRGIGRMCAAFRDRADAILNGGGGAPAVLTDVERHYVGLLRDECAACADGMAYEAFAFAPVAARGGLQVRRSEQ